MRLTTEKQIAKGVRACAEKHALGTPRILYEVKKASRLFLIIGPVAMLVGCVMCGIYLALYERIFSWWPTWKAWLVPGIGLAWFFVGVWVLLHPFFSPHFQLYLCPKGLIYVRRTQEVIRWDQIIQLAKDIDIDKNNNLGIMYKILRSDKRWFELRDDLPHIDRLYGFMEKEVANKLLPTVHRAFVAGQPQSFGDVQLNAQGISIKEGRRNLPWHLVAKLEVNPHSVSIFRKDEQWEWATLNVSGMPNVYVLKGLVDNKIEQVHTQHKMGPHTEPIRMPAISPYIEAYEQGYLAHFGKLSISKQGIRISGQSDLIPWSEVSSFGLSEKEIIIKRTNSSQEWYAIPFWTITDEAGLKELVDYILFKDLV